MTRAAGHRRILEDKGLADINPETQSDHPQAKPTPPATGDAPPSAPVAAAEGTAPAQAFAAAGGDGAAIEPGEERELWAGRTSWKHFYGKWALWAA